MKVIRKVRNDGKTGPLFYGFRDNGTPVFKYQSQAGWNETPEQFGSDEASELRSAKTKVSNALKRIGGLKSSAGLVTVTELA